MDSEVTPGCRSLIEALDDAVTLSDVTQVTHAVKDALTRLIRHRQIDIPVELRQPTPDSYARRLLYRSPAHGYTVLAMVWGPHQGTPLHDHAGIWCVEAVLDGSIEVTQYRLLERGEGRCRFVPEGTVEAGVGTAGCLIPPFEYHTIANLRQEHPSITLHVYGGEMSTCSIFEPLDRGWYRQATRELAYTA